MLLGGNKPVQRPASNSESRKAGRGTVGESSTDALLGGPRSLPQGSDETPEALARVWDAALENVWELADPAYTILTDTVSIHPLLTRNDIEQAKRENPYRVNR